MELRTGVLVAAGVAMALAVEVRGEETSAHDLMPAPSHLSWQAGRLLLDSRTRFGWEGTGEPDPRITAALGRARTRLATQLAPALAADGGPEAEPGRDGLREAQRLPLAPQRGPGLPHREQGLPEAAGDGLGRQVLHAGPGAGGDRLRARPRHPRSAGVRPARALHELARRLSGAGDGGRTLPDRARVGDLRQRARSLQGGGLHVPRQVLRGDGR